MPGPEMTRPVLFRGRRLRLEVVEVGLACCAVEIAAAVHAFPDVLARADAAASPDVHVLVVSGTVATAQAQAVRARYDALPEPRAVLSYGACANTGGPYWDSYAVVPGVDTLVPVDVYVPGCPPRPEALLDGLRLLEERLAERTAGSTA
ncbi:MAG TPA: NADH-quinone oxidoreductase subunit NuoB [Mycobacteriales bacterium]